MFLWRQTDTPISRDRLAEELADVFNFAFLLLDKYDLDLEEIIRKKLEINARNYPIEKARGNAIKHHAEQ